MTALPSANDVRARLDAYFGARPAFRPAPWLTADEPPGHRVLALEGMPGVGKTTLARALRNDDTEVLEEERDELVLNRFLINPEAYAFLFQMYKLSRRQQRCTDLVVQLGRRLPAAARTTIIDRHLPGDMGFALYQYACGRFTDPELDEYMHRAMRIPHATWFKTVYLTAAPERHVERVTRRGHMLEIAAYTAEYFEGMDVCYRAALDLMLGPAGYTVMDWEDDMPVTPASARAFLERVFDKN